MLPFRAHAGRAVGGDSKRVELVIACVVVEVPSVPCVRRELVRGRRDNRGRGIDRKPVHRPGGAERQGSRPRREPRVVVVVVVEHVQFSKQLVQRLALDCRHGTKRRPLTQRAFKARIPRIIPLTEHLHGVDGGVEQILDVEKQLLGVDSGEGLLQGGKRGELQRTPAHAEGEGKGFRGKVLDHGRRAGHVIDGSAVHGQVADGEHAEQPLERGEGHRLATREPPSDENVGRLDARQHVPLESPLATGKCAAHRGNDQVLQVFLRRQMAMQEPHDGEREHFGGGELAREVVHGAEGPEH